MEMRFIDAAPLGSMRAIGQHGYMAAEVPVARTGIQDYAGREVGRPDLAVVHVYRPPEEVFADAYLASMAHVPVTDDHPRDAVTDANWRDLAHGYTGDPIRKDEAKGLVYVPLVFTDRGLIDKLEAGKREVSVGYTCELLWGDGVTPDGVRYQATQKSLTVNHVAVVDRGRAGSVCRVGDNWQPLTDNKEPIVGVKTITHDGVPIEVTDAAEAVINKLNGQVTAANDAAKASDAKVVERDAAIVTKDAEIARLTGQLADAALTPAKLRDAAKVYAVTMAKAKALGATVTDATSEADAHKLVVDAAMATPLRITRRTSTRSRSTFSPRMPRSRTTPIRCVTRSVTIRP